jgi:outer membrane protein assembly factor BamB
MPHPRIIYLGVKGSVIAIDATTGLQIWTVHLTGSSLVNVVLDGDNLYATTNGEIFCLDPRTGDGRWHNTLRGFGWGLVSIAGQGIAPNPLLLPAEEQAREETSPSNSTSSTNPVG